MLPYRELTTALVLLAGISKEEFFGITLRETLYDSVEALQEALDIWLTSYNTERPHLGYRNQGRRPLDPSYCSLNLSATKVSSTGNGLCGAG